MSAFQKHARETRRLFASLPFSVRLAYVFSILAGTDLQALGRALGVIFIKKKVQGLPDIHGKPALDFPISQYELAHKDPSRMLPTNYLDDFASDIRGYMLATFRSEQLVDVAVSNWLFRFVVEGGWHGMHEGLHLKPQVRSYVIAALKGEILNEIKKSKRKKRDMGSIDEENSEGDLVFNPSHDETPAKIYEELPTSSMPKVRHVLEHQVHPDAPLYLDLLLEGYTVTEILGDPEGGKPSMLPHMRQKPVGYKNWKKTYEPKIKKVLEDFMAAA